MDPHCEAIIIRALTEYDWQENCPPKDHCDAWRNYRSMVENACKHDFSDAGIAAWNSGLDYDEQFDSLADARRYLRQAITSHTAWIDKQRLS